MNACAICRAIIAGEIVCPKPESTRKAVYEIDGKSYETLNFVARNPFNRKTDRREFPFHLEQS